MKNIILKTLYTIASIILIFSICCLDSESYIPHITALISMAVIVLGLIANKDKIL